MLDGFNRLHLGQEALAARLLLLALEGQQGEISLLHGAGRRDSGFSFSRPAACSDAYDGCLQIGAHSRIPLTRAPSSRSTSTLRPTLHSGASASPRPHFTWMRAVATRTGSCLRITSGGGSTTY